MNCYVKFVGVLDKNGNNHFVEFCSGLNIITGKSSTGKSAIIEIFDYCFGSSDYTVPKGVITKVAEIYYSVLKFPSFYLVIARRDESNLCFIKEVVLDEDDELLKLISLDFFSDKYFLPLSVFKKELGRYFGITMNDVDEDASVRDYTHRKSSTPSVRSFTSFMLQHQNLVANKHAIFYRFDQKDKREQVIDHFKIFLGIADEKYFAISQELNAVNQEIKKIELYIPKKVEEKKRAAEQLAWALKEYAVITGKELLDLGVDQIVANPGHAIDFIEKTNTTFDVGSDKFGIERFELDMEKSALLSELRSLERNRGMIRSSIKSAEAFYSNVDSIIVPAKAEVAVSHCPFCKSEHSKLEHEANRLVNAINWLNQELKSSPYVRENFATDERRLNVDIEEKKNLLKVLQGKIDKLDKQTLELQQLRSASELAIRAKLKVEAVLEFMLSQSSNEVHLKKEELEKNKKRLSALLKAYDMDARIKEVGVQIEEGMKAIANTLDFEDSYRPANLKFSLDSFDLWHEDEDKKKIFLRSMGSGANWLYSHLTLFLALHRVFSIHSNNGCKIPPILFLDQPTQVYFPNYINDNSNEFVAEDLAKGTTRRSNIDEDLGSVINMFNVLARFCLETEELSGIRPQIIVTDHADYLKLEDGKDFDSYVRARWRTRGFILTEE